MAFEGIAQIQVREDSNPEPLGEGFVTGGSTEMFSFNETLAFTKPSKSSELRVCSDSG